MKEMKLEYGLHHKKTIVKFLFDYDFELKELIKEHKALWSRTHKAWYVYFDKNKMQHIINTLSKHVNLDYTKLTKKNLPNQIVFIKSRLNNLQKKQTQAFSKFLKSKRFSESTVNTYSSMVSEFLLYKEERILDTNLIQSYIEDVLVPKKIAISTHRQFIGAMNHYLSHTKSDFELDFKTYAPRKERKLPNVLSKEEIIRLIQVTKNLKHRVCITLLYSSGLRIGELLNLKLTDLDFNRMLLKVVQGKNKKDRYIPIAKAIMPMLTNYLTTYNPNLYLVENDIKKTVYSPESIRAMLRRKLKVAQITKRVTPHTLRHSYATHLLESGVDIRYIQTLLGHSKPETTMIYTHVTSHELQKINNPLDLIVKQLNDSKNKLN